MFDVVRSEQVPSSLAIEANRKSGRYNGLDVLKQLKEDFFNKCYLCETGCIGNYAEIDHFKPHLEGKYLDRKFDWNNLFYCCGHCNGIKHASEDELLNCTDKEHKYHLYNSLNYKFDYFPKNTVTVDLIVDRIDVVNTSRLLNEIYTTKPNTGKAGTRVFRADEICRKIGEEIKLFKLELDKFIDNNGDLNKISEMLSKKSPFSAFKRQIIKNSPQYDMLIQYFD